MSNIKKDYLSINRAAYDNLASEFEEKISVRKESQERIVEKLGRHITKTSSCKKILEIGPAAGYTTKLLCEKGYDVTAIEISPKLAKICKKTAPDARVVTAEFLSHDFNNEQYCGILAIAFIHLFPRSDSLQLLHKIRALLKSGGVAYISTTLNDVSSEGFESKNNFKTENLRFRRKYTPRELEEELTDAGFSIIDFEMVDDPEEGSKKWMDYMVTKT